jgi:hypothetical protein
VARGVEHDKIPDHVTFGKQDIRHDHRRAGTEVHGKAANIVGKAPGIGFVDGYLCFAHVRDLPEPGYMIKVAVGQDDRPDLFLIRGNRHGHDPCVHENIPDNIGVRPWIAAVQPLDLHAQ